MRFRNTKRGGTGVVKEMASMIDVVFLLLIFFMLTLRVVEPEGDFNISMPLEAGIAPALNVDPPQPLTLRLVATADGELQDVRLGARSFGNDQKAFDRLNEFVRSDVLNGRVGDRRDSTVLEKVEVVIDPDFHLHYRYIVKAISACTGSRTSDGDIVKYLDRVTFAPPRPATT